ncbi:magnesium transporter [Ruminococcaceae bacterium OttesenSCG-928-A16]|nr:magnesium transporter [Ruminococcaceae bacterium OttesenSCG-928-A16]
MTIFLNGLPVRGSQYAKNINAPAILFIPADEIAQANDTLQLQTLLTPLAPSQQHDKSSRFESHTGMDCIALSIPNQQDIEKPLTHVQAYLTQNRLIFIYEPLPAVDALIALLNTPHDAPMQPERALYIFFNLLTEKDSSFLQDIEEEIAALEDELAKDNTEINYTDEISLLRKKLLQWKRYYESLFDLLVDLEENQNGLFTKAQLHYFHILTNRADRLSRAILNLRDYVTQVRESYQAQIDISLNQTMKLFTVLSAIFMPLTLLVGWYGMNLAMPEIHAPYAYPIVIAVSIAIVLVCLIVFKRKKWF